MGLIVPFGIEQFAEDIRRISMSVQAAADAMRDQADGARKISLTLRQWRERLEEEGS